MSSPDYIERTLIVVDDDPTGTQSVSGLPVITTWTSDDLLWATRESREAIYVQTNSRGSDEHEAIRMTQEVAKVSLETLGDATFVSRSDSTLRGHFPAETDTLVAMLQGVGHPVDAVVLAPAFPEAGRITVDGIHFLEHDGRRIPVAETEFATDATFGFTQSDLRDWVREKSNGAYRPQEIAVLSTEHAHEGAEAVERLLEQGARLIIIDAQTDEDLRSAAYALKSSERVGRRFVYRVGPPFVRAMLGRTSPLVVKPAPQPREATTVHGLIVVGSHVPLSARQLEVLKKRHHDKVVVEIDVGHLINDEAAEVSRASILIRDALMVSDVILQTSRVLRLGENPAESLALSRQVSSGVAATVRLALSGTRPSFVVAKGGITSSDVAVHGLGVRQAIVEGPMLPGIVALWRIKNGPFSGVPYVVFPGNVGDDAALADVVDALNLSIDTPVSH